MYDLLDPSRNWPEFLVKDLIKRVYAGLRSEDEPPPKEPYVSPRVRGDLLMSRDLRSPVPYYPSLPRWESERNVAFAWWSGYGGDAGADGAEDGREARMDGQ